MSEANPFGVRERGWVLARLGDVAEIRNELRTPLSKAEREQMPGAFPYYGPTGILDSIDRFRFAGTHVLVGEDGDHFLKFRDRAVAVRAVGRFNVNNHAHVIRGTKTCLTEWLYYRFVHADWTSYLTRQGVARYKLTKQALGSLPIWLPPVTEQRKVAAMMGTWDEAVGKLELLIRTKLRKHRELRHQMVGGHKRLHGFRERWRVRHFGDLAEQVRLRNQGRLDGGRLFGVTRTDGLVPMPANRRGRSTDRCQLVRDNWFAYNPMRLNIGSLARWRRKEDIMVSGDYVVFRCHEDELSPAYFDHVRHTPRFQHFVRQRGAGSVRVRVLFDDLGRFRFGCPKLSEQCSIAEALDHGEDEIWQIEQQREATDRQRRGLIQHLMSGKMRVES